MVQGPQDLPELLKSAAALPSTTTSSAPKQRNIAPQQPPATQAPDTVQLSREAVQAAARARGLAKMADAQGAQLAHPAVESPAAIPAATAADSGSQAPERVALAVPPAVVVALEAPARAAAPAPEPAPVTPVLSPSQAQVLQATPEVRTDRVAQAQTNLSSLSGDSSALNAKLAEKLLTES
jgi:hypothetical protein